MSLEQELKLVVNSIDEINLSLLEWPSEVVCSDVETKHLVSVYYDTPKRNLLKQGLGLRLRKSGDDWLQTVKTSGSVKDGLHQRDEWEHELKDKQWDLQQLQQTPIANIINDVDVWESIKPLFTTDFIRHTIQVTLADKSAVELAYDRGHVSTDNKKAAIHEIELELKAGNVEALHVLAECLFSQLNVAASDCSKAKQGYDLAAQ